MLINSDRFHFLGLQSHCGQWLQPQNSKMLGPWRKSYDKPRQYIKKQRHHFIDKSPYSQSYGFFSSRVQIWELDHKEGWAPKNWCFRTLMLEMTLDSRRSKQSILKKINPGYSLEGVQFSHLCEELTHWERPWCWRRLGRRRGWQRTRWLNGNLMDMSLSKLQEIVKDRKAWHAAVNGVTKSWTRLSNWENK